MFFSEDNRCEARNVAWFTITFCGLTLHVFLTSSVVRQSTCLLGGGMVFLAVTWFCGSKRAQKLFSASGRESSGRQVKLSCNIWSPGTSTGCCHCSGSGCGIFRHVHALAIWRLLTAWCLLFLGPTMWPSLKKSLWSSAVHAVQAF